MTRQEILDAAIYNADRNGVSPSPPPMMMEEDLNVLWGEWADYADPAIVRVAGVISSDLGQWYDVPGYRSPIYISVGGEEVGPVPESFIYYNADNTSSPNGAAGYVVRGSKIRFTSGSGDDTTYEAGASWQAVYYADNTAIPDGAEPYIPDKLHMMLADELAYRWRDKYGGRPISQSEMMTRQRNRSKFLAEIGGRNSDKDTPIQPNWMQLL